MDARYWARPLRFSDCRYRPAARTWQAQNSRACSPQTSSMKEIFLKTPIALATSKTTFPWPPAPHNTRSPISPRLGCAPHELRHGGVAGLADVRSPKHLRHRHPENPGIQPEAQLIHVPHVQLELLLPSETVTAVPLRPAGDSRPHFMTTPLERGVSGRVFGEQGSWTDKAHVALNHVPELRQLIEARASKEPAQRRQPPFVRQQPAAAIAN